MKTAALILASGLSRRFGKEDKLLAELKGQALLAYCLDAAKNVDFDGLFVICPDPDPRADLARSLGFTVINNPSPEAGQGASIALGAQHCISDGFDAVCVLLGDMPFVTTEFLKELNQTPGDIVFSQLDDRDQPPAIFRGSALQKLTDLSGDKGAASLDLSAFAKTHIPLPEGMSVDFDTEEDFDPRIHTGGT